MRTTPPPPTDAKRPFRVTARSIDHFTVIVQARDADEAIEVAEHIDPSHFRLTVNGSWDITDAEPVDPNETDVSDLLPANGYDSL